MQQVSHVITLADLWIDVVLAKSILLDMLEHIRVTDITLRS